MPTDDALITAIRCHFQSFDHDASGKYFDFLQSNDLHKAWYILSSDINQIPLDSSVCLFLCQCNGNSDAHAGHMFISVSKFITVCSDCASYKSKKQKREKRRLINYDEQIKASSQTPFSCLSPDQQLQRFANVKSEIRVLRQKCPTLSNRLVCISSCDNSEILVENNPTAYTLFEKVFNCFKEQNDDMMKVVLEAMMMKLCCEKKKKYWKIIIKRLCHWMKDLNARNLPLS